ncbi:MAG: MerR family transcriptional regulator [Melioribacteraceae bacterium]|nr:MerR family transcriptional regulator [Melioribacteraceae bacterium]
MKDFGLKKLYYSISEVSKLTDLEQYILRYWETEFDQLKPSKNRAGNRIYTNKDIKLILQIKKLLRDEKYTIEGAKKILLEPELMRATTQKPAPVIKENTKEVVDEIVVDNSLFEENGRDVKKDLTQLKEFLIDLKSKL